jgi:hypothetical protein
MQPGHKERNGRQQTLKRHLEAFYCACESEAAIMNNDEGVCKDLLEDWKWSLKSLRTYYNSLRVSVRHWLLNSTWQTKI